MRYAYAPVTSAVQTHHEQEIVFLVNSSDPSLVEAYTNSPDLCRQLEQHGAQRIPTPCDEDNSLRGQLARHLDATYLLKARQLKILSVDELKVVIQERRRVRKRKQAALSEEEKAKRAEKNAYARAWRAKQSPEKREQMREQNRQAKQKMTEYELELRRKKERERWAKLSQAERDEIRARDRAYKAERRARAKQAQS
jgi:hypothetical protein